MERKIEGLINLAGKKHSLKWAIPLALFSACFLAFGLFIPWLGFYQDDWHFVYNAYAKGSQAMWPLLVTNGRPFAAWTYVLGFTTIGFGPTGWHILVLFLRWLTAVTFWSLLQELWPKTGLRNFAAALIFAIHPFFTLQPLAVAYTPHWVAFFLFTLSCFLMVKSVKSGKNFWPWFLLSLLTTAGHIFTIEYFAGLELIRPLILWLGLVEPDTRVRRRKFLRTSIPYAAILVAFVLWRAWIFQGPRADIEGLQDLIAQPFATIGLYARLVWADFALILLNSWAKATSASAFAFTAIWTWRAFLLGLTAALILFGFLYLFRKSIVGRNTSSEKLVFLLFGLAWMMGGLIPAYAFGEIPYLRNPLWNSRLALPSLPGAAIITWTGIELFVKENRMRVVLISILAGLAISFHITNELGFRRAWDTQTNLYRQLLLRVPAIKPNTAIIAEEEILSYMGDYPTAYAMNAIYTQQGMGNFRAPTWFFAATSNFSGREDDLFSGIVLREEQLISLFSGNSLESLYISFTNHPSACLWVLNEYSGDLNRHSQFIQNAGGVSALDRIVDRAEGESFLDQIVGAPIQNWCYFYEKADLARQFNEWESISLLWGQAKEKGVSATHGYELIPFAEAFARLGDWETARQITLQGSKYPQGLRQAFCSLWKNLDETTPSSLPKQNAVQGIFSKFDCVNTR